MPLLYPSNEQEILDYGLHGIAMSRYSGCWVALKLVTDVVETTSRVELDAQRLTIQTPPLPTEPVGGLPHPEVASNMRGKTADYDRWLGGMQKMYVRYMNET